MTVSAPRQYVQTTIYLPGQQVQREAAERGKCGFLDSVFPALGIVSPRPVSVADPLSTLRWGGKGKIRILQLSPTITWEEQKIHTQGS